MRVRTRQAQAVELPSGAPVTSVRIVRCKHPVDVQSRPGAPEWVAFRERREGVPPCSAFTRRPGFANFLLCKTFVRAEFVHAKEECLGSDVVQKLFRCRTA